MDKFLSGRKRNLNIGISSFTEGTTVLQVTGNVGIGTTNAFSPLTVVGDGNFTGVVTASRLISVATTGTSPLSVASSTLVSNLNVEFLAGKPGPYYTDASKIGRAHV